MKTLQRVEKHAKKRLKERFFSDNADRDFSIC